MRVLASRLCKRLVRQLARSHDPRARLLELLQASDRARFALFVTDAPNGSEQLQAWLQAVADASDSLEGISAAIADGDGDEAQRLIKLAHDSLAEHLEQLKGLL